MNNHILNIGVQHFINENLNTDIMSVLLKRPTFKDISQKELAQQIEVKKKCKKKLPTWFATPKIYYPKKLNIEQSSSEKTALYKSQIIKGKTLLDLTGGFGVDSYFFSKKFDDVYCSEINSDLAQIASYNFKILSAENVSVLSEDGITFLKRTKKQFDWIFLDPSRRDDLKGKVFRLKDCSPNILEHLDDLFKKSERVLIKTSPLLDLSQGIKELKNISAIHIVAVKNEVKELLWILKKGFVGIPRIETINIKAIKNEKFTFNMNEESLALSEFSLPLKYLYEPNAAILKSGAFKLIGHRYSLKKLHKHTHLYTSDQFHEFPGRRFKIEKIFNYGKKTEQELLIKNANIAVRNFPESVAIIRKKLKLKDGGETYVFFTKNLLDKMVVLKCTKVEDDIQISNF